MSRSRTYAILSIVLGLLFLAAAAYAAYSYLIVRSQAERIGELETVAGVNGPLEQQVVQQQIVLDSLRNALMELELAYQPLARFDDSARGVFFEVQVGQYRYTDLTAYQRELIDLRQSSDGEINQILLGRFDTMEGAMQLRDLVRKLGFRTAFVVGRVDGVLVSVDDALAAADPSNNSTTQNVN